MAKDGGAGISGKYESKGMEFFKKALSGNQNAYKAPKMPNETNMKQITNYTPRPAQKVSDK